MPRSWWEQMTNSGIDSAQGRHHAERGPKQKPLSRQDIADIRQGKRFRDGSAGRVQDIHTGQVIKHSGSPRDLKAAQDAARAEGKNVIFIKDEPSRPTEEIVSDGCGLMLVGMLLGGGTLIEALVKIIQHGGIV